MRKEYSVKSSFSVTNFELKPFLLGSPISDQSTGDSSSDAVSIASPEEGLEWQAFQQPPILARNRDVQSAADLLHCSLERSLADAYTAGFDAGQEASALASANAVLSASLLDASRDASRDTSRDLS